MTVKEFADKYGVSVRRVQKLIKEGRIPASFFCNRYHIPDDAVYPCDERLSYFNRCFRISRQPRTK